MNDDLSDRIRTFLAGHNTMTLATIGPQGEPQAAAVFYALDEESNLYFLSSPNSRHSRNLAQEPRVAATVQADGQAWQEIRGLQIQGEAHLVTGVQATARAARIYSKRFDFLTGLLGGAGNGPTTLQGPVASSRFYVLHPTWMRLIDNTQGFGHREEVRNDER